MCGVCLRGHGCQAWVVLPCTSAVQHGFHLDCILPWFNMSPNNSHCPTCKDPVSPVIYESILEMAKKLQQPLVESEEEQDYQKQVFKVKFHNSHFKKTVSGDGGSVSFSHLF